MAYLNANIPATYAQVRREYLYDLKEHHGEVEDCLLFGFASITGRLDELELWNCFSYYPSVTSFDVLDGQSCKFIGKDKKWYPGAYLFTVDWGHPESNIVDTDHSEIPQEHKCAHIIALENGNYAAQPNNRIIWSIPSFTVRNEIPRDWKTQTTEWNVEDDRKWRTEDSDRFFYGIEEIKDDKV
jgi:hypothetical protein